MNTILTLLLVCIVLTCITYYIFFIEDEISLVETEDEPHVAEGFCGSQSHIPEGFCGQSHTIEGFCGVQSHVTEGFCGVQSHALEGFCGGQSHVTEGFCGQSHIPEGFCGHVVEGLSDTKFTLPHAKKGVGLSRYYNPSKTGIQTNANTLARLNVSWYYNWGNKPSFESNVSFVPMIWGQNSFPEGKTNWEYVLGFNEPDHPCQSNLSVDSVMTAYNKQSQSVRNSQMSLYKKRIVKCNTKGIPVHKDTGFDDISLFERLSSLAKNVGSPATASNATKDGSWARQFHRRAGSKYDFIALHWYEGADPSKFISYLKKVYSIFGKPIWITEYAPQTFGSSTKNPWKYTQAQIDNFIIKTSAWMEATDYVYRYAWHNSYVGRCALYGEDGALTATGKTYASV